MPRAKVKPQDRQRSVIACIPCKQSKIRCDAGTPCSTCLKRGKESGCVYQTSSQPRSRHISRVSIGGKQNRALPAEQNQSLDGERRQEPREESEKIDSANDNPSTESSTEENTGPKSRMLFSSRCEKVYIGETASLSYLQFLRQVVKHRVGPCTFTEGEFNNYMLEMESNGLLGGDGAITGLDLASKDALAQTYLDATSGVFELFENYEMLRSLPNPQAIDAPLDTATTYLILAIGAQCRGTDPSDTFYSMTLFSQAQKLAFESMLHDPGHRMVRQFLLMAFYMLGACHRNAAFMYLGVASRAASTLGMHRAEYYLEISDEDFNSRANIWKSLRVLDMIVNSILGRAGSLMTIQDPRLSALFESRGAAGTSRGIALNAIFTLCPFMDELERNGPNQNAAPTEDFLHRLQQWSKGLPAELRRSTDPKAKAPDSQEREPFIAGTHVASVYYFAIVLSTRHFLTRYLLPQTRIRRHSHDESVDPTDSETNLAHVCLNAAISLARVGHNALKSDCMLLNMCLVKAWIFAAGLLLGYWLFANGPDAEVEEAFEQTSAIEKKISLLSPQAGHYFDILSSFSEAIAMYQRQLADERKRVSSKYMDNIFTTNEANASPSSISLGQDSGMSLADPNILGASPDGQDRGFQEAIAYDPGTQLDLPWSITDLDFDLQPFASFFDDVLYP